MISRSLLRLGLEGQIEGHGVDGVKQLREQGVEVGDLERFGPDGQDLELGQATELVVPQAPHRLRQLGAFAEKLPEHRLGRLERWLPHRVQRP